jgi:thiamine transporter ThiT
MPEVEFIDLLIGYIIGFISGVVYFGHIKHYGSWKKR